MYTLFEMIHEIQIKEKAQILRHKFLITNAFAFER